MDIGGEASTPRPSKQSVIPGQISLNHPGQARDDRLVVRRSRPGRMHGVTADHYFSAEPASAAASRTVEFAVARAATTRSRPPAGVFSAGRLDPGTAVLLRKAPLPPADTAGPLLDLGCGYGPDRLRAGHRARPGAPSTRSTSTRAPWSWPGATPRRSASADRVHVGEPDAGAGGRALRADLDQPADPGRQGGAARPAAALAAAAHPGRRGLAGGRPGTSAATRCSAG